MTEKKKDSVAPKEKAQEMVSPSKQKMKGSDKVKDTTVHHTSPLPKPTPFNIFSFYHTLLNRYPLVMNCLQSVFISSLAIIVSHFIETIVRGFKDTSIGEQTYFYIPTLSFFKEVLKAKEMDFLTTIPWQEINIMGFINFFYITPLVYGFTCYFLVYLEKINYFSLPNVLFHHQLTKNEDVAIKLFLDQLIFSPPLTAGILVLRYYCYYINAFDRDFLIYTMIPQFLKEQLPKTMIYSWCFWIPMKYLIYHYVPIVYQVLAGSIGAFVWNIIFSLIMN
jgi:hypothetical protein